MRALKTFAAGCQLVHAGAQLAPDAFPPDVLQSLIDGGMVAEDKQPEKAAEVPRKEPAKKKK